MRLFPPSVGLSAYWSWQQGCCSKCYPVPLAFGDVILQHPHAFNLLTTTPSIQTLWPFSVVFCRPCFAVSATHTYGLISVDFFISFFSPFCKCECASSGRSASRHTACMPSPRGTKRKWQGNCHSVSIAMEAQAWLFIPRLMGWRLELKVPDWEKHVPVLFKTTRLQAVVSHHSEESLEQVGITKLTYNFTNITHITSSLY